MLINCFIHATSGALKFKPHGKNYLLCSFGFSIWRCSRSLLCGNQKSILISFLFWAHNYRPISLLDKALWYRNVSAFNCTTVNFRIIQYADGAKTVEIKVRFFTHLREIVGKREETLIFPNSTMATVDLVLKRF
jgi:hypothetical protein